MSHSQADSTQKPVRVKASVPVLRKLFNRNPLGPAIVRARSCGWDEAARWLMSPPGQTLLADAELHQKLRTQLNDDPGVEFLLAAARQQLLNAQPEFFVFGYVYQLMVTLVHQAWLGEYVWRVSAEEFSRIAQLQEHLRSLKPGEKCHWVPYAQLAMYLPPHQLLGDSPLEGHHLSAMVDAPEWLEYFFGTHLNAATEEESLATYMPTFAGASKAERCDLDEDIAWPRWQSTELVVNQSRREYLAEFFDEQALVFMDQPFKVLVAGCGTGKQALECALAYGDQANVLAIDTSAISLAYAQRMAEELEITNIRFKQMDLLDVRELPEEFDVIESGRALYQSFGPELITDALVSRLRPEGLMRLSIYSAIAREPLEAIKREYQLHQVISDDELREVRSTLMDVMPDFFEGNPVWSSAFFCMSGVKDLLFAFYENRFSLAQLANFIPARGLGVAGLEKPASTRSIFRNHYPPKKHYRDLMAWHKYEEQYPGSFANTYEIWCKKNS